jgi:hypothetical protein
MPRRNQGNPFVMLFLFMLPFIIASFFKMTRLERNSRNQTHPEVKKNITKAPKLQPKKDFLVMEEWNTIIPPEVSLPTNDFLLTPDPNKALWYAFLLQ